MLGLPKYKIQFSVMLLLIRITILLMYCNNNSINTYSKIHSFRNNYISIEINYLFSMMTIVYNILLPGDYYIIYDNHSNLNKYNVHCTP